MFAKQFYLLVSQPSEFNWKDSKTFSDFSVFLIVSLFPCSEKGKKQITVVSKMLCASFCKCSNLTGSCFFQCDAASVNSLCQRGKAVIGSQIPVVSKITCSLCSPYPWKMQSLRGFSKHSLEWKEWLSTFMKKHIYFSHHDSQQHLNFYYEIVAINCIRSILWSNNISGEGKILIQNDRLEDPCLDTQRR